MHCRLALPLSRRPKQLAFIDTILVAGKTDWLAGTEGPTIADFVWFNDLMNLQQGGFRQGLVGPGGEDPEVLEKFPRIAALVKRFKELPAVKGYYAGK